MKMKEAMVGIVTRKRLATKLLFNLETFLVSKDKQEFVHICGDYLQSHKGRAQ